MYVCEECGTEDGPIADMEGASMCNPCAALEAGAPVSRTVVKFSGTIVGAYWEVA